MNVEFANQLYTGAYFVALFVPFIIRASGGFRKTSVIRTIFGVMLSAFIMATLVIAAWYSLDLALEQHLSTLDKDGDSVWTEEEQRSWSETDWRYYHLAIGDGGRNVFAVFVFPIFSVIYPALVFGCFSFIQWLKRKHA